MSGLWVAPDAYGEPTIWQQTDNPFGPTAVLQRCDVPRSAWDPIIAAIAAQAELADDTSDLEAARHDHDTDLAMSGDVDYERDEPA